MGIFKGAILFKMRYTIDLNRHGQYCTVQQYCKMRYVIGSSKEISDILLPEKLFLLFSVDIVSPPGPRHLKKSDLPKSPIA